MQDLMVHFAKLLKVSGGGGVCDQNAKTQKAR